MTGEELLFWGLPCIKEKDVYLERVDNPYMQLENKQYLLKLRDPGVIPEDLRLAMDRVKGGEKMNSKEGVIDFDTEAGVCASLRGVWRIAGGENV